MKLSEELRNHPSRDNRALLDRAADRIDELEAGYRKQSEIVRCKDCEYWQCNNGGYPHEECRWGKDETPDADDFCSYAKMKGA